jgi:hypothetical protein
VGVSIYGLLFVDPSSDGCFTGLLEVLCV